MKIGRGHKLLFIGDSITECNRTKDKDNELGAGYVSYVNALLQVNYPERGIRVINKGVSGNTVRDLKGRWQEDVMHERPNWLSILIGMNDVWRQYDTPFMKEEHVYLDEYEETLRTLVTETRHSVEGIILMSPFYIESNKLDAMRCTMDQYGSVVKKIAKETNSLFVDIQEAFDRLLKFFYPAALAWDRIHPSAPGHMVIAQAFLDAINFDWKKNCDNFVY